MFAKSFWASNPLGSHHLTEHSVPIVESPFGFFQLYNPCTLFPDAVALSGTGAGKKHLDWSRMIERYDSLFEGLKETRSEASFQVP
jgi:hypothetical protein